MSATEHGLKCEDCGAEQHKGPAGAQGSWRSVLVGAKPYDRCPVCWIRHCNARYEKEINRVPD